MEISSQVEHFTSLQSIDWLILGTIGTLPTVAEQGEYAELPIGDNGETSDWSKYGGYVGLTLEAVLRDDVRAFKRLPDEVAMGGMRNISEQVAAIFSANSGAGPTLVGHRRIVQCNRRYHQGRACQFADHRSWARTSLPGARSRRPCTRSRCTSRTPPAIMAPASRRL